MSITDKLKQFISSGDERSIKAKKNIILSFANKGFAIIISLAIIPITIDYLDSEQYGIWLTLSSVVAWLSFFDIGLGHGFRNRFAEAKANGDELLARKYVSTTYFTLIVIFSMVFILFKCINPFLNWSWILNISPEYNDLLSSVVNIILIGVCLQFALNVFPIMLSADQKPAISAIIGTVGQGAALLIIYFMTLWPVHSMKYVAVALSGVPVMITFVVSVWMYNHGYKRYRPSIKFVDFSLIRNIINLGIKFFIIQISMILIFQVINIILSRVLGPMAVTEYNVAYKYFSITQMLMNIITAPYWSAFTDAFTKGETLWMKNIQRKLTKVYICLLGFNVILFIISPFVYNLWLGNGISISIGISFSVMVYVCSISFSQLYMVLLNGIGKVFIQMLIYLLFSLVCIPVTNLLCEEFGIPGVMLLFATVYLIQAFFARRQLKMILSNNASGIWNK